MRRRGFTFLELCLVMSLLSVTALLFVSYTGDVGDVSVDAASWKIQSDIRMAQQLAISTGKAHGVQFVQNGNYTVYVDNASTPVIDPLDRNPMVEDMPQFGNVWLANSLQVDFNKMGKPMGGGGYIEVTTDTGAMRRIWIIDNTGAVIVDVIGQGQGCNCSMCAEGRKL